jgi:gamma-glutamylcyclotransferase (GGCT)/AIG2-like uncharacterized protein YtfP
VIQRIFVYGTLLPGQSRWQFLRPCVVDEGQPATVEGVLFDTGLGYPAAVFAGDGRVHGRLFELVAERVDESLAALDLVEHTADEYYRRVVVHTDAGQSAWAYEYTGPPAFTPIGPGSWLDHVAG